MFRIRLMVFFMAFLVCTTVPAIGAGGEEHAHSGILTAADVKGQMSAKDKAIIIDLRSFPEYKYGHIPGAINIPAPAIKTLTKRFPKDKSVPLIIYARGDNASITNKAFNAISTLGYANVKVFPGGILEWLDRHYFVKKGSRP